MRFTSSFAPRYWHVALLICAQACTVVQSAGVTPASGETTTVVVVRHAEKSTDDARDPSLSELGRERARALSALLKDAGVTEIYTTHYKRTRQTAEPFAQQFGVPITDAEYDHVFVVVIPASGSPRLLQTRFGRPGA